MKKLLLFGAIVLSLNSFGQLNVGLIAQYDFSGDALDASGNNYNGTISGPTLVNDRFGTPLSAYSFDGIDDYIEVLSFPTNYANYSFVAWAKSADTTINTNIVCQTGINSSNNDTSSSFGLQQYYDGSSFSDYRGRHRSLDGLYFGAIDDVNDIDYSWHLLVSTFDNDSLKFYVDNQLVNYTLVNSSSAKIDQLLIGAGRTQAIPLAFLFAGIIDDVRIYNRELNECEIEELYTGINPCTTGIDEYNSSLINIYPNPSSDNFKIIGIEKLKNVKTFEITSITGARVAKRDVYSSVIDISSLDKGIYLFVISHENGTEKIRFIKD